MDDYPDIGNTEKKPDQNQLPAPQNPVPQPDNLEEGPACPDEAPGSPEGDLLALRRSLLTEEPEPEVKQNLFQRVTGSLSLKKAGLSEPTFGVKTAGSPNSATPDELQDDFFQRRLGTSPTGEENPGPEQAESGLLSMPEPANNSIVPIAEDAKKAAVSKVQASPSEIIVPGWDDGLLPPTQEDALGDGRGSLNLAEDPKQSLASQYRNPQRFIAYNPKQSPFSRLRSLNRVDKTLILVLILAVIALIIFVATLLLQPQPPQSAPVIYPTPLVTPTLDYPVPSKLYLPGGWTFDLKVGSLVDGKWAPKTSEWLKGTEIRRVIAIPWNKQLEAVFQTFKAGDIIDLDISNGDQVRYKVQSVLQVGVNDPSVLYDTRSSLAIVLINLDQPYRWVIIALP